MIPIINTFNIDSEVFLQSFWWVDSYYRTKDGSDERWYALLEKGDMLPDRCHVCYEIIFRARKDGSMFSADPHHSCDDCEQYNSWRSVFRLTPVGGNYSWSDLNDEEIEFELEYIFENDHWESELGVLFTDYWR